MSTDKTWQTNSDNSDATVKLGERLGQRCRGGEVIELSSDLGGGKTTFTRGLAQGIGSRDHVSSPTFTISKVYEGTRLTMHHFDFYRLGDQPGLIEHELADILGDPKVVIVVEWSESIQHVLPSARIRIQIEHVDENKRKITCTYPKAMEYVLPL